MHAKAAFPSSVNTALVLSILAASLAGCGGGGGSSNSFASESSADKGPQSYGAVRPAQGDWVMYAHSSTASGPLGTATTEAYFTRTFQSVTQDGPVMMAETSSETGTGAKPIMTAIIDSSGALSRYSYEGGESCTLTPSFHGVISVVPGFERVTGNYSETATWNNTAQANCPRFNGGTFAGNVNNAGSITATEQVTVQGRRYSTVKEVYTSTATPSTGNGSARKVDYTCWRDTLLGRIVKCNVTQSTRPQDAAEFREESASTFELVGYSLYQHPLRLPAVSQFAGNWILHYSGAYNGICPSIRIALDGTISGECPLTSASGIQGSIKSTGEFSFATAGGATFTGLLRNPVEGNGTWSTPASGGSWSISHR